MKSRCTSARFWKVPYIAALVLGLFVPHVPGYIQEISLEQGWNLIAIQVAPDDPTPGDGVVRPQDIFGSVEGLISVWAYDGASKTWRTYVNPAADPNATDNNLIPGLAIMSVGMGDALWIKMANNGTVVIDGTKPAVAPAVVLVNGWNLVAIPVTGPEGNNELTEQVPLVAALALQGFDYDTILQWQADAPTAPGYKKNTFGTAETGANEEEFRFLEVNRSYWINVTEEKTIRPDLLTTARGDTDLPPLGNFPNGPEDIWVSGQATPVMPDAQRTIIFFEDEEVQSVSFSNEGGGVMLWEADWIPSGGAQAEPWISLSHEQSAPGAAMVLTGVTTVETEIIHLRLNRRDLPKGTYTGSFVLRTSGETRTFDVTAHVGGIMGEWSGFAEISSVNGKRNPVPDIDLPLSFYEDETTPGLLRGAIDSTRSALWPVDVQLVGHLTGTGGNGFQLGGAFVLPPGDQNQQPFDIWDASASGTDVDWKDDGFNPGDRLNPFPFPIYRSVVLEGELTAANPVDGEGHRIEGIYRELIYGMLRQPIELVGTFQLTRTSPIPFDSLRETVVQATPTGTSPIATGPSPGTIIIASGSPPQLRTVSIGTELLLREARVSFDLMASSGGALESSNIVIELEAPSGQRLVLHDGSAIDPVSFRGASFPNVLVPLGTSPTLEQFLTSVTRTSGEWKVIFANSSGQSIAVQDTSVVLVGQPVVTVHGRVTDASSGSPVQGADVSLAGLPFSHVFSGITDSGGNFTLPDIPAMPVNLSASMPGYNGGGSIVTNQLVPSFSGTVTNSEEARFASRFHPLPAVPVSSLGTEGFETFGGSAASPFEIEMMPEPGSAVELLVFPNHGATPLESQFNLLKWPSSFTWEFGDGTSATGSTVVKHTFSSPGAYWVAAVSNLSGTREILATELVIAMPAPGYTPDDAVEVGGEMYEGAQGYQSFVFHPRFSGGGSLPAAYLSPTTETPTDYPFAAPAVELVMVQHTYAASIDIDLAPFVSAPGETYASDNYNNGFPSYWSSSLNAQTGPGPGLSLPLPVEDTAPVPVNDPGWTYEDHNYLLWPDKWFLDTNENNNRDPGEDDLAGITGYDANDGNFEGPRSTGGFGGPFTHYRMTCNLGSAITPAGIVGASVRSADADPVTSPPLEAGPPGAGVAQNLYLRLTTNLLGGPPS